MAMDDDFSDSFLLQASVDASALGKHAINIVDMLLEESQEPAEQQAHPNVLSQVFDESEHICAGEIETEDGRVIPISIGQTDLGNGKPHPYINISDSPSILSRHVTITTVQTNDGKFRAMLRVNHPQGRVVLGGSVIRPETMYPITDEDEVVLGDGVRFKFRLNNRTSRPSLGGPTQRYLKPPNSDEIHESEERDREEKRRNFQERMTPPLEDSFLVELADPVSLVHQMGDTHPYSSSMSCSTPLQNEDAVLEADQVTASPPDAESPHNDEVDNDVVSPHENIDEKNLIRNESEENLVRSVEEQNNENEVSESVIYPAAPQLSQEISNNRLSPLEERFSRRGNAKRETSEEDDNLNAKKIKLEQESQVSANRRSSLSLSVSPKRLVFLKTAVDIDRSTETSLASIGLKFESKFSDKVDGLVTGSIVRTTKFLCAINKGLAIFPKSILTQIRINRSLPPTDQPELWLQDPEGEAKYGFCLRDSILAARKSRLLENYQVYCFKSGMGEFSPEEFKDLIVSAGGKLVSRLPKTSPGDSPLVVIGSESNKSSAKSCGGVEFFNKIEFLVDACIKQRLDFDFARIDL